MMTSQLKMKSISMEAITDINEQKVVFIQR